MEGKFKIINIDKIHQEYEGDKEAILEIIKIFLKLLPEQLNLLSDAVHNANGPLIHQYAHKLKGSVGSFFVPEIVAQLKELESMGKNYTVDMKEKGIKMIEKVRNDLRTLEEDLLFYQEGK